MKEEINHEFVHSKHCYKCTRLYQREWARKKRNYKKPTSEQVFWTRIIKTENCWVWQGDKNYQGYGRISVGGHHTRMFAHRFSYQLHYGTIPLGLCVLHHCDNPPCVKPDHLFLGTQIDNNLDAYKKGRLTGPKSPLRGASAPNAKLTQCNVNDIRRLYQLGKISQVELAFSYKTSQSNISRIILNHIWI